jgi:uncharacterized protein YegL
VLTIVAIFLPVALVLAGFAINVAFMELTRTELQVAADAASRAGGRMLAFTGDHTAARQAAKDAAALNRVAGHPLNLEDEDIELGRSTRPSTGSRYVYHRQSVDPNSVRIFARRTAASADGPVPLLFRPMMGIDEFQTSVEATSTQVEMDIVLVLDRSGSMAFSAHEQAVSFGTPASAPAGWKFGDPAPPQARWLAAAAAAQAFLAHLDQTPIREQVGLVTYNHQTRSEVELTTNYSAFLPALDAYTQRLEAGATNIGGGIQAAIPMLTTAAGARDWAAKALVVMTDGIHNTGTDPLTAARQADKAGITIFTVTFSQEADQSRMKKVADAAHGQHFHASTDADLVKAFETIAQSLPTLLTD